MVLLVMAVYSLLKLLANGAMNFLIGLWSLLLLKGQGQNSLKM
jgi:hypothetical protein